MLCSPSGVLVLEQGAALTSASGSTSVWCTISTAHSVSMLCRKAQCHGHGPRVQWGGEGCIGVQAVPDWFLEPSMADSREGCLEVHQEEQPLTGVKQTQPDGASRESLQQQGWIVLDVIPLHRVVLPEELWPTAAPSRSWPLPWANTRAK